MVFDLWYPGNAAMTSSGDPSSVGYHPLPVCNTPTLGRAFQPLYVSQPPPGNLPRNSALQTGSDPSFSLRYRVCSNNERKEGAERRESSLRARDAIWVPWVPIFLSTLSLSCSRGERKREREKKDIEFFFRAKKEKKVCLLYLIDEERYRSVACLIKGIWNNIRYRLFSFRFRCFRL